MVGALVGSGKVLVLLGAESTGKTRLADELCRALRAEGHDAVRVPEYLRQFCDAHGRTPRAEEQQDIADTQTRQIAQAARDHALVIADTNALMTAVYSARLFADTRLYPSAIASQRRVAATLLTALDLPWVADGHQRDGPASRQVIDKDLRSALIAHGLPFSVIYGQGPARLAAALAALRPALQDTARAESKREIEGQTHVGPEKIWRWRCPNCDGMPCLPPTPT